MILFLLLLSKLNLPLQNVCTVEELERNLLQMRSGGVGGSPLPPPPGLASPSIGGALRLEDLERKITQGVPQARPVSILYCSLFIAHLGKSKRFSKSYLMMGFFISEHGC